MRRLMRGFMHPASWRPQRQRKPRANIAVAEPGSWKAILSDGMAQLPEGGTILRLRFINSYVLLPYDECKWDQIPPGSSKKLTSIKEVIIDVTAALSARLHNKGTLDGHDVNAQQDGDAKAIVNFISSLNRSRFPALNNVCIVWLVAHAYRDDRHAVFERVLTALSKSNFPLAEVTLRVRTQEIRPGADSGSQSRSGPANTSRVTYKWDATKSAFKRIMS